MEGRIAGIEQESLDPGSDRQVLGIQGSTQGCSPFPQLRQPPPPPPASSTAASLLPSRPPPPPPLLLLLLLLLLFPLNPLFSLKLQREREALSPPIDVDELFDEEHPLNAWVETRQERDVPEFDPHDCSWAEGELDRVETRDPELRVSEDPPLFPQPRHSAILPETSRVPPTQPALRRAATQK
ncbi:hypothetical protein Taro_015369 [Colocasia esculenta]|uniref:Uncharacterized protein n=1 Tax=Colocasia esculenta TaxID=4460 RepID=A0A843UKM8_COLES|nr:hypothetical protein [Colocasia esculenta]